jgi:predicted nucleotidyltransferase
MSVQIKIPQDEISDFCHRNQIRSLALFGSVLRPDFQPDSDVDMLVEFDPTAQVGLVALNRMTRELGELLDRPVDLVPRDGLKPQLRASVLASVEVLYAA